MLPINVEAASAIESVPLDFLMEFIETDPTLDEEDRAFFRSLIR